MTTKKLVPRASGEGAMGVDDNAWGEAYYDTGNFNKGLFVSGHNITQVIAETVTQGGLGGEWTRNGLNIYYSGGNVGIGTTSPGAKLEINGTTMINPTLTAGNNGGLWFGKNGTVQGYIGGGDFAVNAINDTDFGISGATDGDLVFGTTTSSGGTDHERMRITSIGRVGIGNTNPSTSLEVRGAVNSQFRLSRDSSSATQYCEISGGASIMKFKSVSSTPTSAAHSVFLFISDDGTDELERMRIDSSGNVGIGVTDPRFRLDIADSATMVLGGSDDGLGRTNNSFKSSRVGGIAYTNSNPPVNMMMHTSSATESDLFIGWGTSLMNAPTKITFGTASNNTTASSTEANKRMVIDSVGNIGIGVVDPGANLHIQDDDDVAYSHTNRLQRTGATLFTYNTSDTAGSFSQLVLGNRSTNGSMSRIVSVLTQPGTSELSFSLTTTNVQTERMRIGVSGVKVNNLSVSSDVQTDANGYLITSSDKRLKNDLGDCEYGLNEVLQVQPKRYTWKDGPKDANPTVGFFAQDVHDVMPEAAPREAIQNEKGEDDYKWGFHSQTVIAALVNAIKEQQQLIEDLRSEVEVLKNK